MAVVAAEEQLGDLKLYRVPVPVDVNAQGLKQVAFLREENVEGELVYESYCEPRQSRADIRPASMLLETVNDAGHGLGVALPSGSVAIFERSTLGEFLVGEEAIRDYASGQDVELNLSESNQVFATCTWEGNSTGTDVSERWSDMEAVLTNANPHPVTIRVILGSPVSGTFAGFVRA